MHRWRVTTATPATRFDFIHHRRLFAKQLAFHPCKHAADALGVVRRKSLCRGPTAGVG